MPRRVLQMRVGRRACAVALLVSAAAACSGAIEAPPHRPSTTGGGAGGEPGGGPPGGPAEAVGSGGSAMPVATAGPLRRLTNVEYANTLRDLFGTSAETVARLPLLPESTPTFFGTNADLQSLSAAHVDAYDAAAVLVATEALSTPARRTALLGCDPSGDRAGCTRTALSNVGHRVVRRPLQPEELDALVTAAMAEPSANDGLALALRMLLDSSSFLFRVEIGDPAPDHPSWRRVSSAEMATKLAYTLWATTPTPELLAQGEAGALGAPAAIQKTARTMLADERARPVLRRFLQEWLDLTRLPTVTFDTKVLPGWSEGLRSSMLEETTRFLEDLAWSRDGGFGRMLTSPTTFLDANVARSYGMAAPASAWARTDLTHAPSPRAGIMTQPAVLALTGRSNGASAIWRGKYVRERLLCETLARPPANVPQLAAAAPSASERERLAAHRSDPSCAGCHRLLEPVGFGLARYDAAGAYHATDASGKAIDESGKIEGFDAPEFSGAVALATKLSSAAEASSCPTQMLASSLLGRSPTDDDEALMGWLAAAYADAGESLPDAIAAFVGNVAFTHFVP